MTVRPPGNRPRIAKAIHRKTRISRHVETGRRRIVRALAALTLLLLVGQIAPAQRPAQRKPRPAGPPARPPAEEIQLSPEEAFERARSAPTAQQRIELLDKFLKAYRGSDFDSQAREVLMREYALKGEQHLREANPSQAVNAFKGAFAAAPALINDKIFGQYIFPLPLALNAFGYRVEAANLMRSFEQRFNNEPNRLVEIGFFYVQIEAPLEAVRVLERAVQLVPDDHRAHNSLGSAYLISLRIEDAADQFQRALELDARDEYANLNLGNIARAHGDHQKAISYYRKQLAIRADDAEARGGLAISLLAVGRDEEAEGEIKRAMELAPGDYRFLTQIGYFFVTRKKAAVARPFLERAAKIEPRYIWMHIAKAGADAIELRFGDSLSTLIGAQAHGSFPTLTFELARALMALDGYDQAIEVLRKSFKVNEDYEFETNLAGAIPARSPRLDLLIERERRASIAMNEQLATPLQYRLAETLARIDHDLSVALAARKAQEDAAAKRKGRAAKGRQAPDSQQETSVATRPRRARSSGAFELSAGKDSDLPGIPELLRELTAFGTLDDGRQAFRMVWASRKLTDAGIALDAAEQLARQAIAVADTATEPEGSMRDAPLLDREGRRAVFQGRAHDALGWALFKKGDVQGAVASLSKAVEVYPSSLERKAAVWHLAVATEELGNERRALDLYIASYTPNQPTSGVRRARIEALYKKLNGSLAGLDEKLNQQ
jgi:tetratricopeptide (TPR) repeat protein